MDTDLLSFISCGSTIMDSHLTLDDAIDSNSAKPTPGNVDSLKKDMNINPSMLFDEFGPFDIGRIPPGIFLRMEGARRAIREGIMGLLAHDTEGAPIAKLCSVNDIDVRSMGKIHTTMVVKIKPQKGFKDRLRLRGDQQSIGHTAFASAPTDSRDYMRRLIIFLQGNGKRRMGSVDIWQSVYPGRLSTSRRTTIRLDP